MAQEARRKVAGSGEAAQVEVQAEARRSRFAVIDRSKQRRRVSPSVLVGSMLVACIAFGALATHISLIHRQMELDAVRTQITDIQTANKELRQRGSRLQAPDEVRRIAIEELGMVEPRQPAFVTPGPQIVGRLEFGAEKPAETAGETSADTQADPSPLG